LASIDVGETREGDGNGRPINAFKKKKKKRRYAKVKEADGKEFRTEDLVRQKRCLDERYRKLRENRPKGAEKPFSRGGLKTPQKKLSKPNNWGGEVFPGKGERAARMANGQKK